MVSIPFACRRWILGLGAFAGAACAAEVPVILTWSEDPQTTVTVFWQRDEPGVGTVRYGLTSNYTDEARDAGGVRRHRITLRGLEPGTVYHYSVSSTDGFAAGDRTFRTAPVATDTLHVVVYGDLQGGGEPGGCRGVASRVAAWAPDLVIQMGDLSDEEYGGAGYAPWALFLNVATDVLDRTVFMPTPGNHDYPESGSSLFWPFFSLPQRDIPGSPYSFRAGPVHFQALDSDVGIEAQTNWLMRDLQAAAYDTNVLWIIPYFHRPPYSWGEHEGDEFIRTNWCPLFTLYGGDLVFNGHNHNYQRTVPIRDITYVVAAGGGASLYDTVLDPGAHAYATTCYHFVSLQITGSVLRYRAVRSDGLVFEDLTWTNSRRKVRVEPAFPARGGTAKTLYDAAQGPLFYASPVWIHLGVDEFGSALVDTSMTWNASSGFWEYTFTVPASTSNRIAFAFHDAAVTNWDNNYGYNWQALLDDMPYEPPTSPPPRLVAAGTPAITGDPAAQNNTGDAFDFSTNGGPLEVRDGSGFGDLGRLYFNHDGSNLYVGGIGADLGGSNNVFVLFLGLDTLTDNAENLWHKDGAPQSLDQLHNLGFVEPMDLAIVFGDEYGDGPAYATFIYGGYDFGQGIYYIGTNTSFFVPVPDARLSQFDGTGTTACVTEDNDGDRRTDRWEASLPWAALNVSGGATSLTWLLVSGVIASDSTNGNDRYLSATHIGRRAYGTVDEYGNYGCEFVTMEPVKIALEHGDEDGDGMKNLSEFVAGTRLDDAASLLRAKAEEAAADRFVLRWSSESNRTYTLYQTSNLISGFSELAANITSTPPSNIHTAKIGSAQSGFYRVRVAP
ncbi:MAG TPA: metallophosphoesterase [Kiritimatiellia bacterium]|nr:metallophosphoesterase [Kiritimatiellia bacterium]HRZ12077.1 metallophosphoesterase [Kiritimatiellia bacterium]HSA18165.1 metallophosphoesterase [Kiritimatiellia bacterium]